MAGWRSLCRISILRYKHIILCYTSLHVDVIHPNACGLISSRNTVLLSCLVVTVLVDLVLLFLLLLVLWSSHQSIQDVITLVARAASVCIVCLHVVPFSPLPFNSMYVVRPPPRIKPLFVPHSKTATVHIRAEPGCECWWVIKRWLKLLAQTFVCSRSGGEWGAWAASDARYPITEHSSTCPRSCLYWMTFLYRWRRTLSVIVYVKRGTLKFHLHISWV